MEYKELEARFICASRELHGMLTPYGPWFTVKYAFSVKIELADPTEELRRWNIHAAHRLVAAWLSRELRRGLCEPAKLVEAEKVLTNVEAWIARLRR